MSKSSANFLLFSSLLLCSVTRIHARTGNSGTSPWKTPSGKPPLVVARGGFSGLFPDSSYDAYNIAQVKSVPDVILWCDVQLTKDGAGICFSDLNLENSSTVSQVFPDRKKSYLVNGIRMEGYFPIDFTREGLMNITSAIQVVYSRSNGFDRNGAPIMTIEEVIQKIEPAPLLWLNIQHDTFYEQHNLSVKGYMASTFGKGCVTHITSPEIAFLQSILPQFRETEKTDFRFLSPDAVELSTNQTYSFLLKNLTHIREFASGILVPKGYIWPDDGRGYLLPHTSLVSDAHRIGLEVYVADFANDLPLSYNYSFDPLA